MAARKELFELCLKSISLGPGVDAAQLAAETNGYSGADIHLVCREAAMMPMRRLLAKYSPQDINQMKSDGTLNISSVSLSNMFTFYFNYLL